MTHKAEIFIIWPFTEIISGNPDEEEITKQKLRVKNARTELNDFCDETGRARRSNRERTPINATWPDE